MGDKEEKEDSVATTETPQVENAAELLGELDGSEEGITLTGGYLEMEIGENIRCLFIGNTEMKAMEGEGTQVAVRLLCKDEDSKDGKTVITASTMIVQACRGLAIPTKISITLIEIRDLDKKKKLNVFEVKLLN